MCQSRVLRSLTMSTNLNVIALISGGKDSIFSIYHCRARGHKVVALANLFPVGNGQDDEDMDSFMYQTVGHSTIPLYAEALDIPLFRSYINGTAINADKYYDASTTASNAQERNLPDETESLLDLVIKVKAEYPQANAVCTGAILSDYQRSRVESVALRLGLQSLAYLWQYPYLPPHTQTSLLEDMNTFGHKAIIIKVASGGLSESFLGQNVADSPTIAKLRNALSRFGPLQGGSVLGEGGEYETLSIDGPDCFWRASISTDHNDTKVITGTGGTAALSIKNSKLSDKHNICGDDLSSLRIPNDFDPEFERVRTNLQVQELNRTVKSLNEDCMTVFIEAAKHFSIYQAKDLLYINNLNISVQSEEKKSIMDQMSIIIDCLASILKEHKLASTDIISSTLLLRSMSDFQPVNTIYGAFFSKPLPPARVTIACGESLPANVDLTLSVVVNRLDRNLRHGLHVQSVSYWAPANIGPYSQAIGIAAPALDDAVRKCETVLMAGQIPLVPATMKLLNRGETLAEFKEQTVLSLQHLWRVGRAMSVDNWLVGIAFIARPCPNPRQIQISLEELVEVATSAWGMLYADARKLGEHVEENSKDEVDVWDQKYGLNRRIKSISLDEAETRHRLPNLECVESKAWSDYDARFQPGYETTPPCFVVEVDGLPRGALIEWTSLGLSNSDLEVGIPMELQQTLRPIDTRRRQFGPLKYSPKVKYHSCRVQQTGDFFVWLGIEDIRGMSVAKIYGEILHDGIEPPTCTVYAAQHLPDGFGDGSAMQVIPCRSVWDQESRRLAAVLSVRIQVEGTSFPDT